MIHMNMAKLWIVRSASLLSTISAHLTNLNLQPPQEMVMSAYFCLIKVSNKSCAKLTQPRTKLAQPCTTYTKTCTKLTQSRLNHEQSSHNLTQPRLNLAQSSHNLD